MPIISVRIPQLGEGLQEALLVEFLKRPGDKIKRDDHIYVMETDKATTEVESPYEGTLVEWTVEEGSVLEIGREVAKMEVAAGVREIPVGHAASPNQVAAAVKKDATDSDDGKAVAEEVGTKKGSGKLTIPPRTRKYLKEKGLLEVAEMIPAKTSKLMPEDVDRYLETQPSSAEESKPSEDYEDHLVPRAQQTLNFRLLRGVQSCVPVTILQEVDWTAIAAAREITRQRNGETGFVMLLWCVLQALKNHSKFRSSLIGGKTLRTFKHVHLGIGVALPGDVLVTAVVKNADLLTRAEFNEAAKKQIELARQGHDQVDPATTTTVSNIGSFGIRWGIPAIVSPAMATLAVGEIFEKPFRSGNGIDFKQCVELVMTFDHRVANGVGAAEFINDVKKNIETFSLED